MDGLLKLINPANIVLQKPEDEKKSCIGNFGQIDLPQVASEYFVESSYAVMDVEYIHAQQTKDGPMEEFFVVGLDDGTVHAYAYSKNKGKSFTKRVIPAGGSATKDIDGPYDQFADSTYEHQDSIVSVESNPACPNVFLTGSKDGHVFVWELGVLAEGKSDFKAVE